MNWHTAHRPYLVFALGKTRLFPHIGIVEDRLGKFLKREAQEQFSLALRYALYLISSKNFVYYEPLEKIALTKLVYILPRYFKLSLADRARVMALRVSFLATYQDRFRPGGLEQYNENLWKYKTIEPEQIVAFKDEIKKQAPLWTLDSSRQQSRLTSHSQTNALYLFDRRPHQASSTTTDTEPERYAHKVAWAPLFPKLCAWIKEVEAEMEGKLGRVAIVRLAPRSMVHGHIDREPYLQGFDRYHLVIDSPDGSYMHVDDEHNIYEEGDLFFFENKKWHTAYNPSKYWRTHLIFDIRPPKEKAKSLPIYSYEDWKQWSKYFLK